MVRVTLGRCAGRVSVRPAERFGQVFPGMTISVTPEIGQKQAVNARVEQVDPFVDAASATFRARLTLANANRQVPAGARCQVALPTDSAAARTRALEQYSWETAADATAALYRELCAGR